MVFKLGYVLALGTILLMVYLSLTSALINNRETEAVVYPPCFFNPLCTCSKAGPDLGIVGCRGAPLPKLPSSLNQSKVFKLQLENNGLRSIESYFLQHTGMFRLEISWNPLKDVSTDAFSGLERSLHELELKHNQLTSVPSRSLRYLQRLRVLDLTGNDITDLTMENWGGLKESLQTLILRDNGIFTISPGVFKNLKKLEHLDLSGNLISDIDPNTFRDGPEQLTRLYLFDNMFVNVPYQQLASLRNLRHLDMSLNRINQLHTLTSEPNGRQVSLSLDTLRLDYNQIQYLPPGAFEHFDNINKTYLDGNHIAIIQGDAFHRTRIRELSLRDCSISELAPGAFTGLERDLQVLDFSGNNLTILPQQFLQEFASLRSLSLSDNFVKGLKPGEAFNGFQFSLHKLDLSGSQNSIIALQDLKRMGKLRSLCVSKLPQPHIAPDDFQEFGQDLEELKISDGNLKTIKNHAFRHVRGLKKLDLSENSISSIEKDAFVEIGHSLNQINIAYGFSSSISKLPTEPFKQLTNLEEVDFSNNKIKTLPETFFHLMKRIRFIQLQDNIVDYIQKGTFQGDMHTSLEEISFSFNQLSSINTHTFVDLNNLKTLKFDDNKITKIEKRAFMNLDRLKYLDLRGNRITTISDESFQNLPELEELDLAYNSLTMFDFTWLDQVGTLSTFRLNVSHNEIKSLDSNFTPPFQGGRHGAGNVYSNVKELDFSYNNISHFGRGYMKPVETSLTHFHVSHNSLRNATQQVFGNLHHLQWLDLSWNKLEEIEFDCFRNSRKLQVLYLSHNRLTDIAPELFRTLSILRILDISHNRIRSLPDVLFKEDSLERLDVSHNQLTRLPLSSFGQFATENLVDLDLSHNFIAALHAKNSFGRFKNLQYLDLSHNRLVRLDDDSFASLPALSILDLSHNQDLVMDSKGRTFTGLEDTLHELYMKNLSIHYVPEMQLPSLRHLDLSDNKLSVIPTEISRNLSSLRTLNVNGNELTVVPPTIQSFIQLRHLSIGSNPIHSLNFQQGIRLRQLDIRHLPLNYLEVGALAKIQSLQTLRLSPFRQVRDFNLPHLLQDNHGLEHLHVELHESEGSSLGDEMSGAFPAKLRNITLSGRSLKSISNDIFQGIRNPRLNLRVYNTSLDKLPKQIFEEAKFIRNLTIDVRGNYLKTIGNPNTAKIPNTPRKIFLYDLYMADNSWTCDCDLGWVEGWERKTRQYICPREPDQCRKTEEDRRVTLCENKQNKNILDILKADLECGWSGVETSYRASTLMTASAITVIMVYSWS